MLTERFAGRVSYWRLARRTLEFPRRPLLMGIVNVTPDSFSDGGRFLAPQAAIDHALRLAADGADLIDLGGESTRPYSQPVSPEEQVGRVLPVVEGLAGRIGVPISIDTSSAIVARAALAAGAEIINDITALTADGELLEVVARNHCGVCLMHMQGTPATMQDDPQYGDVVAEVLDYLRCRRDALVEAGVPGDSIALDPGIGFGKTHQHNLTLLASAYRLHELGCPVLVGHSRKGFIAKVLGDKEVGRTAGNVGVSLSLAAQGVQVIRVHDVATVRQALLLFEATGGIDGQAAVLD